ncbi:MAG: response regulator, partial [Actinobacteria bacterium]|nr:response regulator [Actinomycetota bacterium]MSX63023.1 response regulator [Actinomycetota bacterium]
MNGLIMIVDDEAGVRDLLTDALRLSNFETIDAKDGMSALTLLRKHTPDLLIIDI